MSELKAVLWDLDGTLIDSEGIWFEAINLLLANWGGHWSEQDHQATVGSFLPVTAGLLQGHGVSLPSEVIIEQLTDHLVATITQTRPFTAGAIALFNQCAQAGLAQALVTMSYLRIAQPVNQMLSQLAPGGFTVLVTGDKLERGKPAPDPYLAALAALDLASWQCVALEDSPNGVTSALAAGIPTVAVPGPALIEPQIAVSRVASLEQVNLEMLERVCAGELINLLDGSTA